MLAIALVALAACALLILVRPKGFLARLASAAGITVDTERLCSDALTRRLAETARHQAREQVEVLGRECEDCLISANLAMALRLPNMAAAYRRTAARAAREALSIAHEAGA